MGVPRPPAPMGQRRVKRIAAVPNTLPLQNMKKGVPELGRVGFTFCAKSSLGKGGTTGPGQATAQNGFL